MIGSTLLVKSGSSVADGKDGSTLSCWLISNGVVMGRINAPPDVGGVVESARSGRERGDGIGSNRSRRVNGAVEVCLNVWRVVVDRSI